MAANVVIPSLGLTMEAGVIVEWVKKEGDRVEKEEPIAVIETDKATADVNAPESGILGGICAEVGESVPVGQTIAVIYAEEEFADGAACAPAGAADSAAERRPDTAEWQSEAAKRPSDTAGSAGSGLADRPAVPGPEPGAPERRPAASPAARKRAAELGIDLGQVTGTGPGGRILEWNVNAYERPSAEPQKQPVRKALQPLTAMRRTIAGRMIASRQSTAAVTIFMEARMDEASKLREQMNRTLQKQGRRLPFDALFVKAAALALVRHPVMQEQWDAQGLVRPDGIHLGVAVALPDGLVVPVVRHADTKSLFAVAEEIERLAKAARENRLRTEEMEGGTFTVSNLGMYPVGGFTPVIQLPESSILGIGAIRRQAVVEGDRLEIGRAAALSLTFDHRIADGAPAAAFLAAIKELLEQPYQLFLESESGEGAN